MALDRLRLRAQAPSSAPAVANALRRDARHLGSIPVCWWLQAGYQQVAQGPWSLTGLTTPGTVVQSRNDVFRIASASTCACWHQSGGGKRCRCGHCACVCLQCIPVLVASAGQGDPHVGANLLVRQVGEPVDRQLPRRILRVVLIDIGDSFAPEPVSIELLRPGRVFLPMRTRSALWLPTMAGPVTRTFPCLALYSPHGVARYPWPTMNRVAAIRTATWTPMNIGPPPPRQIRRRFDGQYGILSRSPMPISRYGSLRSTPNPGHQAPGGTDHSVPREPQTKPHCSQLRLMPMFVAARPCSRTGTPYTALVQRGTQPAQATPMGHLLVHSGRLQLEAQRASSVSVLVHPHS